MLFCGIFLTIKSIITNRDAAFIASDFFPPRWHAPKSETMGLKEIRNYDLK